MTKIIITVGPATDSPESALEAMVRGARGFRFPASKFDAETLAEQAAMVARLADSAEIELDLLLDLPGSKARLTNDNGFALAGLSRLRLDFGPTPADRSSDPARLGVTGVPLDNLVVGDTLVLGDGEDALLVEEVSDDHCMVRPLTAGELGRRRGIVVAGKAQQHETLTDRDVAALRLAPSTVFSAVILSFVESADVIRQARQIMDESPDERRRPSVVAKIETRAGVEAVDEIAAEADALLLGRGDLLLEVGEDEFFDLGRTVMRQAGKVEVPLIVGTQVLPSLSTSWLPNRSELAYACHLMEKGIDALLLSTETTVGRQPHRTIGMLSNLIDRYGKRSDELMFEHRGGRNGPRVAPGGQPVSR